MATKTSKLRAALSKGTGPMGWDLWECGLSARVRNWAHRSGLRSVADLIAWDPKALAHERGIGQGQIAEIRAWLEPVVGVTWEDAHAAHPRPRAWAPPAPPQKRELRPLGEFGQRWDALQHELNAAQAAVFVYVLPLSVRMLGYCERNGVELLGDLVKIRAVELCAAPNLNRGTLRTSVEVIEAFSRRRPKKPSAGGAAAAQAASKGSRPKAARWDSLRGTLSAEVLAGSVLEVSLPARLLSYCEREGVETLGDLVRIRAADLLAARNLSSRSLIDAAAAIDAFQLRRAQEKVLWQDGLLEGVERQLQGFTAEQRLVFERRAGLRGAPQTQKSIATDRGVFTQAVDRREQLVVGRLLRREGWIAELRMQFDRALADGMVDLRTLAQDSWWTRATQRPEALAYICRRLLDQRWHVVSLGGAQYLAELTQEQLVGVTLAARRRAQELELPRPLSALRALFNEVLREQLGGQRTRLCAAAKQALWSDLADRLSVEGDPPRVVAFGHSKRAQLVAFLRSQPEPLPVGRVRAHVGIRYLPDDAFYFGRGLVGVEKHFPDFAKWRQRLVPRLVRIMRRDPKRQWHCKRLLQALREEVELPSWFDHWHVANVVRRTDQLEYLRRLRVALPGTVKDSKRLYVREVILQILTEQGRPMSTSELLAEARQRMDVIPGSMPANPRPPIVKVAPGVWGLAERDLPSASRRGRPARLLSPLPRHAARRRKRLE